MASTPQTSHRRNTRPKVTSLSRLSTAHPRLTAFLNAIVDSKSSQQLQNVVDAEMVAIRVALTQMETQESNGRRHNKSKFFINSLFKIDPDSQSNTSMLSTTSSIDRLGRQGENSQVNVSELLLRGLYCHVGLGKIVPKEMIVLAINQTQSASMVYDRAIAHLACSAFLPELDPKMGILLNNGYINDIENAEIFPKTATSALCALASTLNDDKMYSDLFKTLKDSLLSNNMDPIVRRKALIVYGKILLHRPESGIDENNVVLFDNLCLSSQLLSTCDPKILSTNATSNNKEAQILSNLLKPFKNALFHSNPLVMTAALPFFKILTREVSIFREPDLNLKASMCELPNMPSINLTPKFIYFENETDTTSSNYLQYIHIRTFVKEARKYLSKYLNVFVHIQRQILLGNLDSFFDFGKITAQSTQVSLIEIISNIFLIQRYILKLPNGNEYGNNINNNDLTPRSSRSSSVDINNKDNNVEMEMDNENYQRKESLQNISLVSPTNIPKSEIDFSINNNNNNNSSNKISTPISIDGRKIISPDVIARLLMNTAKVVLDPQRNIEQSSNNFYKQQLPANYLFNSARDSIMYEVIKQVSIINYALISGPKTNKYSNKNISVINEFITENEIKLLKNYVLDKIGIYPKIHHILEYCSNIMPNLQIYKGLYDINYSKECLKKTINVSKEEIKIKEQDNNKGKNVDIDINTNINIEKSKEENRNRLETQINNNYNYENSSRSSSIFENEMYQKLKTFSANNIQDINNNINSKLDSKSATLLRSTSFHFGIQSLCWLVLSNLESWSIHSEFLLGVRDSTMIMPINVNTLKKYSYSTTLESCISLINYLESGEGLEYWRGYEYILSPIDIEIKYNEQNEIIPSINRTPFLIEDILINNNNINYNNNENQNLMNPQHLSSIQSGYNSMMGSIYESSFGLLSTTDKKSSNNNNINNLDIKEYPIIIVEKEIRETVSRTICECVGSQRFLNLIEIFDN